MNRSYALCLVVAVAAASLLVAAAPAQAAPTPSPGPSSAGILAAVPDSERDSVLPRDWRNSRDRVVLTVPGPTGLHLMVAEMRNGYAWRTAATLAEPGFDADQWIGNVCVTGSGRHAVAVYAPRTFTNDEALFDRGAFTAVVDLESGAVTKIPVQSTLAYFSPGCGAGETAVVTRFHRNGSGQPQTRLTAVNPARLAIDRDWTLDGELTSAVPVSGGVVAADGSRLVRVSDEGVRTGLVRTTGVAFHLRADGNGAVVYTERSGDEVNVNRASARPGPSATTLARGPAGRLGTVSPVGGRVFLVGQPTSARAIPAGISRLSVDRDMVVSSHGQLVITKLTRDTETEVPLRVEVRVLATGKSVQFGLKPSSARGRQSAHPSLTGAAIGALTAGSPSDPIDADRACSIPRNDPRSQVYQPTPRQVEWASDQAVTGNLTMTRPANWRQSGLPAWSPQGMFPRIALTGGGRVPAQILLGILAQESNLWQASGKGLPGVTANPLIGNFYGRQIYNADPGDDWAIDWSEADCGYGVAQVTDGMRLAGHERPGETALPPLQQRAIALDYATNLAAGLRILISKWNQTRQAGLIVNDGDPANIENWFFAVWAYNSGFHPNAGDGSPWGVGWFNNPANPRYPADRAPFLEYTYNDAARPQLWPYPEKVLGWAGHPIESVVAPNTYIAGYRAAWWTSVPNRITVKPPIHQFCDSSNDCVPGASFVPNDPDVIGEPAGPCGHRNAAGQFDLRCWYHQASIWKDCNSQCGFELLRFDATYPEQPDGVSYPASCTLSGLPANALIIDDVPDSVPAARPGCGHPWTNQGSFVLTFAGDSAGHYPSKVDFHQIGAGFGGHFWFAHTRRSADEGGTMKVTGTWTLAQNMTGWARVMVHMPDHGAHTQQARYEINLGNGTTKTRVVLQRTLQNRWVSLGAFAFNGTPSVRLTSESHDGDGSEDIAYDAIAFQPLPGKPRHEVVALGDSYSSGEGASDYYQETDNNGGDPATRNACHRSRQAWSRKAVLPDNAVQTIGQRADSWDPAMDFHLLACSGAETEHLLPYHTVPSGQPRPANDLGQEGTGQFGELSQLDRGFLDENTTLVTLSIGGNDVRFADILSTCILSAWLCQDVRLEGDNQSLSAETPLRISRAENSILLVLRQIHAKAPHAKIILMGYPQLLENLGQCVPGIGTSEAPWLNQTATLLAERMNNAVVRANAEGLPVWFSNPTDEFAGKGVCGNPESIHGIVWNKTLGDIPGLIPPHSQQSFHPTPDGAGLYAASMNQTVGTLAL